MTPDQYRRALRRLELSIVGAGEVLNIKRRQSQRYAAGHAEVPGPLAGLLRFCVRHEVPAGEIRKLCHGA
jgi:hypothetical protein